MNKLDDINSQYDSYQEDLAVIEKKLKLLPEFSKDQLDELISILEIPEEKKSLI